MSTVNVSRGFVSPEVTFLWPVEDAQPLLSLCGLPFSCQCLNSSSWEATSHLGLEFTGMPLFKLMHH